MLVGTVALGVFGSQRFHAVEPVFAVFESWGELLDKEAVGDSHEIEVGLIVVAAVAGDINELDGSEIPENVQALAGASFADSQPVHDIIQGHGIGGNEQDSIDFTDRFRKAQHLDEGHEILDRFQLEVGKSGFD